jgi:hypothetical protein
VLVPEVIEEVDLVFTGEDRGGDTVYWCVTPPLREIVNTQNMRERYEKQTS